MQDAAADPVMQKVHDLMGREFGRLAPDLDEAGDVQLVYLPGGDYALVVARSSPSTVTVHKTVGRPDFSIRGLSDYLLREHSTWLFGRLERNGDALAVEHTLHVAELDGGALATAVKSVHEMAVATERFLSAAGALTHDAQP